MHSYLTLNTKHTLSTNSHTLPYAPLRFPTLPYALPTLSLPAAPYPRPHEALAHTHTRTRTPSLEFISGKREERGRMTEVIRNKSYEHGLNLSGS